MKRLLQDIVNFVKREWFLFVVIATIALIFFVFEVFFA
jgi:hypothetical protein